jgi:death on curing protein
MSEPVWLLRGALEQLHDASIAQHGGAPGLRDDGLFESALARPQNLLAYEGVQDLARLAASYAFGLAENHAFVDGNKRIAFIAAATFLRINNHRLVADQSEAALIMFSVASSAFTESELADWIRNHMQAL